MTKAKIQAVVQSVNKINFENRRKPEVAKAITTDSINEFIEDSGISPEAMIDRLQAKLDENPNSTYLATMIEMLRTYV